ncbi:hypothetical protein SAMN05421636_1121 [Pricia antarctica]|uniref:Uncharacterized protein n=1 Tax=Pricia antarctica TaxID=641691 RepID=A0A1G7IF43_9FLAO|nr:hypothetical protein SAMN05421636_1121 [Pricia antarctica]
MDDVDVTDYTRTLYQNEMLHAANFIHVLRFAVLTILPN